MFTGKAYRDDDTCALAAAMHAVPRMLCLPTQQT